MDFQRSSRSGSVPADLPPHRTVAVRAADGTRLHTRVFGPQGGQPVVLAHGITCSTRVWGHQIADLAADHRVIAYDHRGHGRSDVPGRDAYSLDHLAADLDAVLEATLQPGERAILAGHSMGGMAISAWSDRYRHRVSERAAGVALINTTTGDLLRHVDLLQMPAPLRRVREQVARRALSTFGGVPIAGPASIPARQFVTFLAVGRRANPAITEFIYELFTATPVSSRGRWVRVLVNSLGPTHIGLDGLTVPALVIGSKHDRLLPMVASRRIAANVPNLSKLVELPGGHCSILEHPETVNRHLRELIEVGIFDRRLSPPGPILSRA